MIDSAEVMQATPKLKPSAALLWYCSTAATAKSNATAVSNHGYGIGEVSRFFLFNSVAFSMTHCSSIAYERITPKEPANVSSTS